ncbi:MAG: thioredoxin family protein [Rubricoccaceae bacterium]
MRPLRILGLALVAGLLAASGSASAQTPDTAPGFTLTDTNGNTHRLIDYRGKTVVLEWLNYDCPFVRKHYATGNMQRLQATYTGRDVVWLAVVSSAPGEQGYFSATEMNRRTREQNGRATAVLLDPTGQVGRAYGARTTPHMYVINPQGQIVYNGAIDDRPTSAQADVEGARNYVSEALEAVLSGRPVPTARTQPYGCSVKYAAS